MKNDESSQFSKRVHSLTSFNKRSDGNRYDRKIRLLTENDVDERNQSKEFEKKQFQRSHNYVKAV